MDTTRQPPSKRTSFPEVSGHSSFAHPVWPARRPVTEWADLRRTLTATLGFREGWTRRHA